MTILKGEENGKQLAQERASSGRVLGTLLHSPTGAGVWRVFWALALLGFTNYYTYLATNEEATTYWRLYIAENITKVGESVVDNRCLNFAIIELLDGPKMPDRCIPVLVKLRRELDYAPPQVQVP